MIIDGKAIAKQIQMEISEKVSRITGRKPSLAVVLVGADPASQVYVRNKKRACARVGMDSISHELPDSTSEADLVSLIQQLNADPTVDGILVQLPLPSQISEKKIIEAIDPCKDVDGFHPINVGKLLIGDPTGFVSCTPLGVKVLLERSNIPVAGKRVVVLGRSNIVGKPLAALLMQKGPGADATVTVCHSRSDDIPAVCQEADIIVAAVGRPHFLTAEMVREGTVVVDVGINRLDDPTQTKGYRLIGDADFEKLKTKCSHITPVPGGVGPMTVTMLLNNTFLSYCRREAINQDDLSADREVVEAKP